jgi:hypothetical protein
MLMKRLLTLSCFAIVTAFAASPASALTMKECSSKYQAAKDAGSLDGKSWAQFRKAECGTDDSAEAPPAKTETKKSAAKKKADDSQEEAGLTSKECSAKYQAAKDADALNGMKWNDFRKAECGPGASATFAAAKPKKPAKSDNASDDDQAAGLTTKECSAKYQAAKDADALNGMKWNDFRKAECGPGASKTLAAAKPAKPAKSDTASDDEAPGLSMKDCSAKYQAAKDADALNGLKWNDFRKAECGPGATMAVAKPEKKAAKTASTAASGNLSMKECSAKYQAAKASNSLNGMKWNDFRKAECGANAADDDTVPSFDEASYTEEPETPVAKAPRGVSFPKGLARKFISETPAKARMHTCLEEYYNNKDAGTLNGLRWIQKGGGYYSLCNARLKQNS